MTGTAVTCKSFRFQVSGFKNGSVHVCIGLFCVKGANKRGKRWFLFNGLNKIGQKLASSLNNLHLCPRNLIIVAHG